MALIPMIFKADGGEDYPKKGKIRAEDLSALFAFSLPKKTGVLNVLGTCTAYNTVVSNGYATITFHNGYVVICGRLIYIEESTSVTISLVASGTVTGKLGIRVSLSATGVTECEWFSKTGNLTQDDLNNNPIAGVYEMALYDYNASPTTFVLGNKVATNINPNEDLVEDITSTPSEGAKYPTDDNNQPIIAKGTIDGRLTNLEARITALGFSEVDATSQTNCSGVHLKRQGNYVICTGNIQQDQFSFNIPDGYRPKQQITFGYGLGQSVYNATSRTYLFTGAGGTATITTSGVCSGSGGYAQNGSATQAHGSCQCSFSLGWECNPRSI